MRPIECRGANDPFYLCPDPNWKKGGCWFKPINAGFQYISKIPRLMGYKTSSITNSNINNIPNRLITRPNPLISTRATTTTTTTVATTTTNYADSTNDKIIDDQSINDEIIDVDSTEPNLMEYTDDDDDDEIDEVDDDDDDDANNTDSSSLSNNNKINNDNDLEQQNHNIIRSEEQCEAVDMTNH